MLPKAKGLAGLLAAAALMFQAGSNVAYAAEYTLTGTDPVSVRAERTGGGVINDEKSKSKAGTGTGTNGGTVAGTQDGTDATNDGTGNTATNDGTDATNDGTGNTATNDGTGNTASNGQDKVTICHRTGSETNPWVVVTVARPAWENAHKAHGDMLVTQNGSCPANGSGQDAGGTVGGNTGNTDNTGNTGNTAVAGQQHGPGGSAVNVLDSRTLDTNVTLTIGGQQIFLPAGTQLVTTDRGTIAVLPSGENVMLGLAPSVLGQQQAAPAGEQGTQAAGANPGAVAGQQSAGGMAAGRQSGAGVLGISNLPSTSSSPAGLPLGALGASLAGLGIYLLRRKS